MASDDGVVVLLGLIAAIVGLVAILAWGILPFRIISRPDQIIDILGTKQETQRDQPPQLHVNQQPRKD